MRCIRVHSVVFRLALALWVLLVLPMCAFCEPVPACRLVLVLDKSGSMLEDERWQRLVASVTALVASLPEGSEVAVVIFDEEAKVLVPLTKMTDANRKEILAPIDKVTPAGGTDILAGLSAGVKLLRGSGGAAIVVSDGLQTGDSDKPQPESVWGEPARKLTSLARANGILIHSIGLGPEVQADPLLILLAADSGGSFYGVRKAQDLIRHFVGLASQLGRFWQRSEAGEFRVTASSEDVVQVVAAGNPPQLLRSVDDKLMAAVPAHAIQKSGVRVERFRLAPGTYHFEPAASGHSDLLRPMTLSWSLPRDSVLEAGRNTQFVFSVKPVAGTSTDLRGLLVSGKFAFAGGAAQTVQAAPEGDGRIVLPITTPSVLKPFEAALEVEEHGWHYKIGTYSGGLIQPAPIKVAIKPHETLPICLTTSGEENEATVHAEATLSITGHPLELLASCSDPTIRVSPNAVKLQGRRQSLCFVLSRGAAASPLLKANLSFAIRGQDVVPPRFAEGRDPELEWSFTWRHLQPRLVLHGLSAPGEFTVERGKAVLVPVTLKGIDIKQPIGVVLAGSNSGFHAEWVECLPHGDTRPLPVLEPTATAGAALRITTSKDMIPGRYVTKWSLHSTDPKVGLNGSGEPVRYSASITMPPVSVVMGLPEGLRQWQVMAPIKKVSKEVRVEVHTVDGGPLPPLQMRALAKGPVQLAPLGFTSITSSRSAGAYECSIASQTPRFEGNVQFTAIGDGIVCPNPSSLAVAVPPMVVQVHVPAVRSERFPDPWEHWLGWLHPTSPCRFRVDFSGDNWEACEPSWSVRVRRPSGKAETLVPGPDGDVLLPRHADREVVLAAKYEPTVFEPVSEIPVPDETAEVPVPTWVFLVGVAVAMLPLFILMRPRRLKVLGPGGIYRAWRGYLYLDRALCRPGLGLVLRLGFRGAHVRRRARSRSEDKVILRSAGSNVTVAPGLSVPARRGDVIELHAADGSFAQVEILTCGWSKALTDSTGPAGEIFGQPGFLDHSEVPKW